MLMLLWEGLVLEKFWLFMIAWMLEASMGWTSVFANYRLVESAWFWAAFASLKSRKAILELCGFWFIVTCMLPLSGSKLV